MSVEARELDSKIKFKTDLIILKFIKFCKEKISEVDVFKSNPAKEYLKKRGILKERILREFAIGYCPEGSEIEFKEILKKENLFEYINFVVFPEKPKVNQQFLFNRVGKFTFSNRVIFPIISGERIESIYGRDITGISPSRHKYSNPYYEGFFNLNEVKNKRYIIITEGIIDALTLLSCGYINTIGYCKGAYNYNSHIIDTTLFEPVLETFKKVKSKDIYICFDFDQKTNPHGQRNAIAFGMKLSDAGFSTKIISLDIEGTHDINEIYLSIDASPKEREAILQEHIENAMNDPILWEELYVRLAVDELDLKKEEKDKILNIFSYAISKVKRNIL
jgi:hypothetical protein